MKIIIILATRRSLRRETGKVYHQDNYVANILFSSDILQTEIFNGTVFNISGEVIICSNRWEVKVIQQRLSTLSPRSTINEDNCKGIVIVDSDSIKWNEDGSITYSGRRKF